jgi:hypothetical protein
MITAKGTDDGGIFVLLYQIKYSLINCSLMVTHLKLYARVGVTLGA